MKREDAMREMACTWLGVEKYHPQVSISVTKYRNYGVEMSIYTKEDEKTQKELLYNSLKRWLTKDAKLHTREYGEYGECGVIEIIWKFDKEEQP